MTTSWQQQKEYTQGEMADWANTMKTETKQKKKKWNERADHSFPNLQGIVLPKSYFCKFFTKMEEAEQ